MAPKRKLIGFDPETWQALELLSRDSGKDLQELADEAFVRFVGQAPPAKPAEGRAQAKRSPRARQRK